MMQLQRNNFFYLMFCERARIGSRIFHFLYFLTSFPMLLSIFPTSPEFMQRYIFVIKGENCIIVRMSHRKWCAENREFTKPVQKRDVNGSNSQAVQNPQVARRNLRKRDTMNDSERSRARERERTEKVDDRFVFIGEKGIERAPGRKRTHELIMATCVPPPSPRFLSLGSSRFARPVREAGSGHM